MMGAPLILSLNVRNLSQYDLDTYGNREVIAIDQDFSHLGPMLGPDTACRAGYRWHALSPLFVARTSGFAASWNRKLDAAYPTLASDESVEIALIGWMLSSPRALHSITIRQNCSSAMMTLSVACGGAWSSQRI